MVRDFIHGAAMELIDSVEESIHVRDNRGRERQFIELPEIHIIEKFLIDIYKKGLKDASATKDDFILNSPS